MQRLSGTLRRLWSTILALNPRERILVGASILMLVVFLVEQGGESVTTMLSDNERAVDQRKRDLESLTKILKRYSVLRDRKENLQQVFVRSQLTFEQVVTQLDHIVKESIGSDNYELKPAPNATPFGLDFEKQDFTVNVKSLTIEQLVKLLHELEQGDRPLYLSKLDITRGFQTGEYSANLEIFSIRKSSGQQA